MINEPVNLEWERQEVLIENHPHHKFQTKGEDWCYTIEPLVNAKRAEPLGYYFAGWAKKRLYTNRMRVEGNARTLGECISMCQAHMEHIKRST